MGKLLIAIVCLIDFVVLPILMFTSAAQSHSATGYVYGVNCFLYFCAVFKMIIVFFVIVVKTASYVYDSKMDELVEAAYWMYFIFWVVWTLFAFPFLLLSNEFPSSYYVLVATVCWHTLPLAVLLIGLLFHGLLWCLGFPV